MDPDIISYENIFASYNMHHASQKDKVILITLYRTNFVNFLNIQIIRTKPSNIGFIFQKVHLAYSHILLIFGEFSIL